MIDFEVEPIEVHAANRSLHARWTWEPPQPPQEPMSKGAISRRIKRFLNRKRKQDQRERKK